MSSSSLQEVNDAVLPTPEQAFAMQPRPAVGEVSFKRRLTERFAVPGTMVLCHRRTLIGTWKPAETPFHVYNVGMGGVNFWSLGATYKPGTKIKLTLAMPRVPAIEVVGVVVWNKDMPQSGGGEGTQQYSQITGVKFVDYDAAAWAVLRMIPQIVSAESRGNPTSRRLAVKAQSEELSATETGQIPSPRRAGGEPLELIEES
jgi:hypothetical protein